MSGSRKWFKYTTDTDVVYALNMDESNGDAMGNADYEAIDAGLFAALPRNIKPRQATYRSLDGKVTRVISVTDKAANISTLPATLTVAAIDGNPAYTLNLVSYQGERFTQVPTGADSGLDDGSAT